MSFATIAELRGSLGSEKPKRDEYAAKMLHEVPESTSVDRNKLILERCTGKRVLEFGASGPLHTAMLTVAAEIIGVDREDSAGVIGFDLDDVTIGNLPVAQAFPELIVCGEVLEHLSNPGHFLARLKTQYPGIPVIISVPNGLSQIAAKHIAKGIENVNPDHVAWYSWKTLSTLLSRVGYQIQETLWYNGPPRVAEGLIVVVE